MIRLSMFPFITVNVMNSYVDHVCISEDNISSPKVNGPSPLYIPCPNIYPIVVPKLIIYVKISHFVIVFCMYFMRRYFNISTLSVSKLKHSISFMIHFNYSEIILSYCTVLVLYTLAAIILGHFGYPCRTSSFVIPLT